MNYKEILIPVMSRKMAPFARELGTALTEKCGAPNRYIPQNREILNHALNHIDENAVYESYIDHEPDKSLESLVSKYGITSSREFVFPQMVYDYRYTNPSHRPFLLSDRNAPDYNPYLSILHRTLDYLDDLYEGNSQQLTVQFQGAEILRRSIQRVSEQHDTQSIWIGYAPLVGFSGLYENESMNWKSFNRASYSDLSEAERERATEFVRQFRADRKLDSHGLGTGAGESSGVGTATNFGLQSSKSFTRSVYDNVLKLCRNGTSLPYRSLFRQRIAKRLSAAYAKWKYLDIDASYRVLENEYVFYPIQYYRESRVAVRARPFYDQSWFVEYLSRSVPHNHELVVKDHPQQLGAQPRHAIQTYIRHARPVAPSINPHDVIEHADAVVTLNNATGYEALLYGKPVVALGEAFYTGHGYTYDVADLDSLGETVFSAIKSGGLNEEEVVEFAHAVLEGSYPGEWLNTDDENIDALSSSILRYLDDSH